MRKTRSIASRFTKPDVNKMLCANTPFAIKEAYNSVRTKLMFTAEGDKCAIFAITSTSPISGKTINTLNMAISFAQMGKKTLIIDADMRNPMIHKYMGISCSGGLSEFLAGMTDKVNVEESGIENLSLISAGDIPPNPAELLASKNIDDLLSHVRERFDIVFIDTPPIQIVSDATVLAKKITGYVMVVHSGKTNIYEMRAAISSLKQLGAKIAGFLLNDITGKGAAYYNRGGYRYGSGYSYKYDYSAD